MLANSGLATPWTQKISFNSNARSVAGESANRFLICVANGNTHMSHGAINRCTEGRTIECGPPAAEARRRSGGGGNGSVGPVRLVTPPGLSLPGRGRRDRPLPIGEPSVPITLKIPGSVVRDLRNYSAASGLTLGEIVARAISTFLKATRRHG